jgi:glycosyltransferase involved in cell wall biosynthesis
VALPCFDIYFQPSLWEAMSIAILEAMVSEKPVVSTLVGEAPHLIDQDRDGLLYPASDIAAMATAILALASDSNRRRQMGIAAKSKVAANFTVGHTVRAHESLYLEMLSHRQRERLSAAS